MSLWRVFELTSPAVGRKKHEKDGRKCYSCCINAQELCGNPFSRPLIKARSIGKFVFEIGASISCGKRSLPYFASYVVTNSFAPNSFQLAKKISIQLGVNKIITCNEQKLRTADSDNMRAVSEGKRDKEGEDGEIRCQSSKSESVFRRFVKLAPVSILEQIQWHCCVLAGYPTRETTDDGNILRKTETKQHEQQYDRKQ